MRQKLWPILAILTMTSCGQPPPVTEPALDLPIVLTAEGWQALDAADPEGSRQIDRVNAQWLCAYAEARPEFCP